MTLYTTAQNGGEVAADDKIKDTTILAQIQMP